MNATSNRIELTSDEAEYLSDIKCQLPEMLTMQMMELECCINEVIHTLNAPDDEGSEAWCIRLQSLASLTQAWTRQAELFYLIQAKEATNG